MHTDSCLFFDFVFVHFLLASIYICINVEVEIVSVHVSIIIKVFVEHKILSN